MAMSRPGALTGALSRARDSPVDNLAGRERNADSLLSATGRCLGDRLMNRGLNVSSGRARPNPLSLNDGFLDGVRDSEPSCSVVS